MNIGLEIKDLYFTYGDKDVLNGVSFDIESGGVLSILGRSGSGKSTLLKCISSLITPNRGNLYLNNQEYFDGNDWLYEPWELRQKIALVFQGYNLLPNLSVNDNITLALRVVQGVEKDKANSKAKEITKRLGIEDVLDKYPNEISGGQAQRTALARAFILSPPVLLLDEITSAIDPTTINNVAKVLNELRENEPTKKTTVLMVTHNIQFAIEYSNNIAFLDKGKFVEYLPASKFLNESKNPETLEYINDSKYYL